MSRTPSHSTEWDEFRWEQEIQRDELRINCYFRTLPRFLDLPGEDEMLAETISARPELKSAVPGMNAMNNAWSYLSDEFAPEPESGDENDEQGPPLRRPGENLIEAIDGLAAAWNGYCALNEGPFSGTLSVACLYARLLARAADFFDVPEKNAALKRCLGKRTVGDLQELIDVLNTLEGLRPRMKRVCLFHKRRLAALGRRLKECLNRIK